MLWGRQSSWKKMQKDCFLRSLERQRLCGQDRSKSLSKHCVRGLWAPEPLMPCGAIKFDCMEDWDVYKGPEEHISERNLLTWHQLCSAHLVVNKLPPTTLVLTAQVFIAVSCLWELIQICVSYLILNLMSLAATLVSLLSTVLPIISMKKRSVVPSILPWHPFLLNSFGQ